MDFIENLFVDSSIKDINTVIYSLKKGIAVYNIYVICVDTKSDNIAHMLSSKRFFAEQNRYKDYRIIGLASGKLGADRLFAQIIEYWVEKGMDISSFKEKIIKE